MSGQRTFGEIINPSDAMSIETTDWMAACASVLLIGSGSYGIEGEGHKMPLFLFAGFEEVNAWWQKEFPGEPDLQEFLGANHSRIADALDSVCTGNRAELEAILLAIPEEQRDAARLKWQDRKRSSLNDIASYAWDLAKAYRAKATGATS